jgi:phosphoenolpyruvate carboxykinase (GTP)
VRRDPFAMLPFVGYHMSDYFQHWLNVGEKIRASGAAVPKIYCVNWFRTGADGKFIWPGFGDNMRVLQWILGRVNGEAGGAENIFGTTPRFNDMTWDGLEFSEAQFEKITSIDKLAWQAELSLHSELFDKLKHHLPQELADAKARLEKRLAA